MEFELDLTYLVGLLLALVVLKIVFLALLNFFSDVVTDGKTATSSVNGGFVAKQTVVDRGLRVRSTRGRKKRVKFVVDDAVIRRVDLYAGFENSASVEEERKDGNLGERVDDQGEENGLSRGLGGEITKELSYGDVQDRGSSEIEMQIGEDCNGDELEKEKTSASSGPASVVVEGSGNPLIVEEERKGENSGERVGDQTGEDGLSRGLGGEMTKEQSYGDAIDKGSSEIEIQIGEDCNGDKLEGSFSEEKTSTSSAPVSLVVEGSGNPLIVEEERKDENSGERVDDKAEENGLSQDLGGEIIKEQSYDDAIDKGSSEFEIQIEKDGTGDELEGSFSEEEPAKTSANSGPASGVVEGSENPSSEEERKDENSGERVDDKAEENGWIQGEIIKEQSYDDAIDKGSSKIDMQIGKDCTGDELEKEKTSASGDGGPASGVVEEEKKDEVFENDDVKIDQKEGNQEGGGLSQDLGGEIIKEKSYDDAQDNGSSEIEMQTEKHCNGDEHEKEKTSASGGDEHETEKTSASGGPASVVVDEVKNKDEVFENDEVKIDQGGGGENDELVAGDNSIDVEDEEWEGIERTELEKVFAEAVNYMEYGFKKGKEDDQLAKVLGNDVQLQLYGLHKVAVEGPCHEPQPMALKLSARAKWNAWQKLGSMSQDEAMEQYIKLLSDGIPGWMHNYSAGGGVEGSRKVEALEKMADPEYERKLELAATPINDSSMGHGSLKKDGTL